VRIAAVVDAALSGVVPMAVRDFVEPSVYFLFNDGFTPNMKARTDDSYASTAITR
jgi:hypothetical protein